ncbi:hypothetical protein N431DRAFT_474786 [Stipitochalara longipes BDJ]|nr:hypothetical protein N431DRAFT_474786 [Stipitochalara longipes BDJ]
MPAPNPDPHNADRSLPRLYFMAVDTRAVEIFVECGVLDPLRGLINVDVAKIDVIRPWDGEPLTLQQKYHDMVLELEFDIEYNGPLSSIRESSASPSSSNSENEDSEEDESESEGGESGDDESGDDESEEYGVSEGEGDTEEG